MSYTVGYVSFREDAPVKAIDGFLKDLSRILQCEVEWDPTEGIWWFYYRSSGKGEDVLVLYGRYRDYLDVFVPVLLHL